MASDSFLPKLILGVVLALVVPRLKGWFQGASLWVASPHGDGHASHADAVTKVIEQSLGESWVPRKPSEMTIARPVAFNPEGTGTEIIPYFLPPDDPLKNTLRNRTLWTHGPDNSWWENPSAETVGDNIWRALAWRIYQHHPLLEKAVGIEYWTNIGKADTPLDWHVDKDTDAWFQNGNLITPLWGAVFYGYPHEFRGGYLEIMVGGVYEEWPSHVGGELERIRADYNRLIRFNASKWHRVSPITDGGERMALAVNLWDRKPSMFA